MYQHVWRMLILCKESRNVLQKKTSTQQQQQRRTTMKKRSEETQTLRAGCSKAEPKISPRHRPPYPSARDGENLISWRWSLPLPANPFW